MSRLSATVTGLAIIILSGLVHGKWTGRWGNSPSLEPAIERMNRVPVQVGSWVAQQRDLDPRHLRQAGISAAWMRIYTDRRTGTALTVLLMCGPAGPVAAHPPEVCYPGAGYEIARRPIKVRLDANTANIDEFWTARFSKANEGVAESVRLFWAWSVDGHWQAADYPRIAFGHAGVLYKLYVIRALADDDASPIDPSLDFLRDFVPEADTLLFPQPQHEPS